MDGNAAHRTAQAAPKAAPSTILYLPARYHLSGYGKHKIIQDHVYDKKHIYV